MIDLIEFVWPRLRGLSKSEAAKADAEAIAERRDLSRQSWRRDTDVILEEARRLTDAEAERRKTADAKAATYLTVVGVLTPILSSLAPTLSDSKANAALRTISAPLLILAVVYLVTAGIWAFRTLRVGMTHRVDTADLVTIWSQRAPKAALVGQLLRAAYANRGPVNDKVSRIKMTDAFLVRAFVTFAILLVVQAAWKPVSDAYNSIHVPKKAVVVAPLKRGAPPAKPDPQGPTGAAPEPKALPPAISQTRVPPPPAPKSSPNTTHKTGAGAIQG